MYKIFLFILSVFVLSFCKPKVEHLVKSYPSNPIQISSDSLIFDTLLLGEDKYFTQRLKVYNTFEQAIKISSIKLGNADNSNYFITVNGIKGSQFSDIELLGKDSLLVLVSLKGTDSKQNTPLLEDSLLVNVSQYTSKSHFIAWGQNAEYFYNDTINNSLKINANQNIVIVGNLLIDSMASLEFAEGSKAFFANNAKMLVKGGLKINGNYSSPVIFTSVRRDGNYENQPGLWQGVEFVGSKINVNISSLKLNNALVGFDFSDSKPDNEIKISNSQFYNFTYNAMNLMNGSYEICNSIFYNSVNELLYMGNNGSFKIYNCTFCNNSTGFSRDLASVSVEDKEDVSLDFQNNIVTGDLKEELLVNFKNLNSVFQINNNLIKGEFNSKYSSNIFYKDKTIYFKDLNKYNFVSDTITKQPLKLSPIINAGTAIPGITDMPDIFGKYRDGQPDLGAIEN